MKSLNETFTEEEWAKLMRVKNAMTISWHDLLLESFARAEPTIKKLLLRDGYTEAQIEEILSGKVRKDQIVKEPCAADIAREARDKK